MPEGSPKITKLETGVGPLGNGSSCETPVNIIKKAEKTQVVITSWIAKQGRFFALDEIIIDGWNENQIRNQLPLIANTFINRVKHTDGTQLYGPVGVFCDADKYNTERKERLQADSQKILKVLMLNKENKKDAKQLASGTGITEKRVKYVLKILLESREVCSSGTKKGAKVLWYITPEQN